MTKHRSLPLKEQVISRISQHPCIILTCQSQHMTHAISLTGVRTSDSPTIQLIYLIISFSFIWQKCFFNNVSKPFGIFTNNRFQTVSTTVSFGNFYQCQPDVNMFSTVHRLRRFQTFQCFKRVSKHHSHNTMPDQLSTNRMFLRFAARYVVCLRLQLSNTSWQWEWLIKNHLYQKWTT